jgi:hypothetical protein
MEMEDSNKGSNNMNIKIIKKVVKKATKNRQEIVSFNGIAGFWKHPRHENCWIYNGRMPIANCWVFVDGDNTEIDNVKVHDSSNRKSGFGSEMVSDIRKAFPEQRIWVDTWNCARPFWEKMQERGHIDDIENDYSWPCINTTCKFCHPNRTTRRSVFA